MPIAYIMDFAGSDLDAYEAVCASAGVGPDAPVPEGAIFHAAGLTDTGLRVIDIWESDAAFQRFGERLIPAQQQHGVAPPQIQRIEMTSLREGPGGGADAVLVHVVRMPGVDADMFAAMDRAILPDGGLADGCGFHVNGPIEGGWMALGAWSSSEARDAFLQGRVAPAIESMGVSSTPVMEDLPVHRTLVRDGAAV